ncbi:MAG TPA: hypothetical protein VJB34_03130 [Bdellovibrionota bacterium]|nr:hypothetical protein [Bdellovibrionota bacterium]
MKKLQLILVLIFSLFQFSTQAQSAQGKESSWKGPTLLKSLELSHARNEELQNGNFAIMLQNDADLETLQTTEVTVTFSNPNITTPYSQIKLGLETNYTLTLLGFHYDVHNHLFIHGRYRIDKNDGQTSHLIEQGKFSFFAAKHEDLIEQAVSLFFSEKQRDASDLVSLDVEQLCAKKWKVSSVELRDRSAQIIETLANLEELPLVVRDLKISFTPDGKFILEGLNGAYEDVKVTGLLEGTYKVFGGRLVLLKTKIGEQEFKWLIRILSQDENQITTTTNTQLFTSDVYDVDGLRFEDTVTLVPVTPEPENTDEK